MYAARARPPHVAPELAVDFDFFRPGTAGCDPFEAWARLSDAPPMVWTPHNGGHWIATRGEDIRQILGDHQRFSSRHAFIPPTPERPRGVPLEYDPPEHGPLRQAILPAFTPKAIARWSEEARALATDLVAQLKPRGGCEFMADFARQLPIVIFLRMVGVPISDRERLLGYVEASLRPTSPEARLSARQAMNAYIADLVAERRARPGQDMLSEALSADIGGRPLTEGEAMGLTSGLLGGGLDTVAASMGWVALFLAEHPAHRRRLVDSPALIPQAIDEMLRRFSVPNIARVVRADMDWGDARLKAGEQVLLSACLQALDPRLFPDPFAVDFDRPDARRHLTFSTGVHRCVGSALALQELRAFLEAWLAHIPDFVLDPADPPVKATGIAHSPARLPLVW